MSKERKELDIINGPLLKNLVIFAIPLMLTNLMQSLFNVTDTIIVGKFAGDQALAAVGATGSLSFLIISLFYGVSMGTTVIVGQLIGKGDRHKVSTAVETSYALSILCGAFVSMIGILGARFFLSLMSTPDDIIDKSALYMKIYFCSTIFILVYNTGSAVLRAKGDSARPLYFLIAGGITNVTLNLLFVAVFKMAVAGVALATAISQLVSASLVTISLIRTDDATHLDLKKIHLDLGIALDILRIGIPAGIQSSMYSISNVVMQGAMNSFNDSNIIAGNTVGSNIENFAYIGMYSFSQSCITFTSQNYGAKQYGKIRKIMRITLLLSSMIALGMSGLLWLLRYPMMSLYTSSDAIMHVAELRIKIVVLTIIMNGVLDIFVGSMRGMGTSTGPTVLMILGICGVRVAWVLLYFPIDPRVEIIYFSYPLSWTVTSLIEYLLWLAVYRKVMLQSKAESMN
ncbi:MAG: MATE family efflux transporter [Erysipelotrichaceae bacterium]|nr:MATE family efflux transporter [Erysipelotrichaceae bacterium]